MELSDILSATSVLLVFLFYALEKLISSIFDFLKEKFPDKIKETEFQRFKFRINSYLKRAFLAFIILFSISYIFCPTTYRILEMSEFDIWDFNLLNTLFILIETCLICVTVFVAYLTYRIISKRKDYKKISLSAT